MTPPRLEAHNEHQRRYYTGRRLPRMDPVTRSDTPYTRRHVEAMVAACGLGPQDTVLDVGCGPGKYTVGLVRAGCTVEGMDLTPGLLETMRAYDATIRTYVGDLCDPPPELEGRYDAVVGFFMLHHVGDPASALAGARRLLRPGGRAGFLEPNPLFPGYYVQVTCTPRMSWRGERGILRMWPGRLAAAAASAGFSDFATARFGAFPPFLANRSAGSRAERLLESVPGWGRCRAFQLFTMQAA